MQFAGGLLIAGILGQFSPIGPHLVWWLTISICSISYYVLFRQRLSSPANQWPIDKWFRQHLYYRALIGALWGWPLTVLYTQPESVTLLLIVTAIYTFVVLMVALENVLNGTMAASTLPMVLVLLVVSGMSQNTTLLMIAAGLTVFGLVMIQISLIIRKIVRRVIDADYKREEMTQALIDKTQQQKILTQVIELDKERLQLLAEHSTDMIAMHAPNGRYLYVNEVVTEILGYKPSEIINTLPLDYVHPDDKAALIAAFKIAFDAGGKRQLGEFRMRRKDGSYIWVETSERQLPAKNDEEHLRTVTVSRDVEDRHAAAVALAAQQQTLETSFSSIRDAVITLSADGKVLFANEAALALSPQQTLLGLPMRAAFALKDEQGERPLDWTSLSLNQVTTVRMLAEQLHFFEMSVHRLQEPSSDLAAPSQVTPEVMKKKTLRDGYVVVLRNITQRRELEQELRLRAYTDALTGVMNRVAFEERLQAVSARVKRSGGSHALVFVDLDQFKIVNDTAGHHAGDALLKEIANTLRNAVREGDVVARLGGDEFALLLADCLVGDAKRRCQQVCDAVAAIDFEWETKQYPVGASFGVAMFDSDIESVESLMGRADAACYVVKDQGRNGVHLWTKDNVDSGRQFTDMNWVSRLQSALKERRILIYGQQIWDLETNSGHHLEVLISLRDVDGSLVSPIEFIPAAERYGVMPAIDHYVMEAVFRHIAPLQSQLLASDYRVAINLSGHTIGSDVALDSIRKLFHHYAINPSLICFEITETAALRNMAEAQRFLMALKNLGCQLALDDFGTGFSSFSYLKSLPVDILKIDGEFVREMLHKETDYAIVEGIHKVGQTMGLKTVAECVENEDILRELRALGVDYGQGMHLSQRRPLKEIISKKILDLKP